MNKSVMKKWVVDNWDRIQAEYKKKFWDILYEDMPKVFQFAEEMFRKEHPDGITVWDNVKS